MKKAFFIFFLALVSFGTYANPISINEAISVIRPTPSKGEFTEIKTLVDFPNPIKSQGKYSLSVDKLVWETQTPFETTLIVSSSGISFGSGSEVYELSAKDVPGIGTFSLLFTKALLGDFTTLKEHFVLSIDKTKNLITVSATPKTDYLAQEIRSLTLKGESSITEITIYFKSGAKTQMNLYNITELK